MQEGTRQGMGEGRGASTSSPGAQPSKYLHAFTSQEVLWAPLVVRIFTQAVLHWHDWSDHWSLVINSTSSQANPLRFESSCAQPSHPGVITLASTQVWLKGASREQQKLLLLPLPLKKFQGF